MSKLDHIALDHVTTGITQDMRGAFTVASVSPRGAKLEHSRFPYRHTGKACFGAYRAAWREAQHLASLQRVEVQASFDIRAIR